MGRDLIEMSTEAATAGLGRTMDRRGALRLLLGAGAAAVAGGAARSAGAAGGGYLQTTAGLNLRAGPSTGDKVLRVIPQGARVFDHGELKNGFRLVTYDNVRGWAFDAYLTAGAQVPPHAGPVIGTAVVAVALNLRAGPSTGETVLRVMAKGDHVEITNTVAGGFRYVYHQG
ncbi:MAG: SH3 domain-containing protein, partial [Actinomycetes bacterium]